MEVGILMCVLKNKVDGNDTNLKIVHHLGKGQPGGGHCNAAVAATLHTAMVIGVRLVARVSNHIDLVCKRK